MVPSKFYIKLEAVRRGRKQTVFFGWVSGALECCYPSTGHTSLIRACEGPIKADEEMETTLRFCPLTPTCLVSHLVYDLCPRLWSLWKPYLQWPSSPQPFHYLIHSPRSSAIYGFSTHFLDHSSLSSILLPLKSYSILLIKSFMWTVSLWSVLCWYLCFHEYFVCPPVVQCFKDQDYLRLFCIPCSTCQ